MARSPPLLPDLPRTCHSLPRFLRPSSEPHACAGRIGQWRVMIRIPLPRRSRCAPARAVILSDLHLGASDCQSKEFRAGCWSASPTASWPRAPILTRRLQLDRLPRLTKSHWKFLSLLRKLSDHLDILGLWRQRTTARRDRLAPAGRDGMADFVLESARQAHPRPHGHVFDEVPRQPPVLTWMADRCILPPSGSTAPQAWRRWPSTAARRPALRQEESRHASNVPGLRRCERVLCGHTPVAAAHVDQPILLQQRLRDLAALYLSDRCQPGAAAAPFDAEAAVSPPADGTVG